MWKFEELSTVTSDLSDRNCSSSGFQTNTGVVVAGIIAVVVVMIVAVAVVVIVALILKHRFGHISMQTAQE